jgi:putative ABC transport system substrate-binding protein
MKGRVQALYVVSDPFFATNRIRIHTLAMSARLPTMHGFREYVEAGGLVSYGASFLHLWRRASDYVDKILRGTNPATCRLSSRQSSILWSIWSLPRRSN